MNEVSGSITVKCFFSFLFFFSVVLFLFFLPFFPGSSVGNLVTFKQLHTSDNSTQDNSS